MRRSSKPLVFAMSLCLLSLQLTGVHAHADESGFVSAPETAFAHSHDHHEHDDAHHDHEDGKDVSLLEPALSKFKMPLAMIALILLFCLFPIVRPLFSIEFAYRVLSGRHTRWRPPLRAPPEPA